MPDDNDVRQLYPHLCRALGLDDGFDPTDSSVRKSTVALLTEINHLLSTEYELVVQGYGNKNINYVRVPQTFSDDSFRNKVHLMMKHVEWQMKHIRGGLGDKMEDRVERMHQDGMRERRRFCTVKNPVIRAKAREKVHVRDTNADVIAFTNATNAGNKRLPILRRPTRSVNWTKFYRWLMPCLMTTMWDSCIPIFVVHLA